MMVRYILILILLSARVGAVAQSQVNTFKVVDKETQKVIPYALVGIERARLAIATQTDGIFVIPGNLAAMRDTIVFNAQNYRQLKLPLKDLAKITIIELQRMPSVASAAVLNKYANKLTLNSFNPDQVGRYAGMPVEGALFDYLQIAQRFEGKTDHDHLLKITMGRARGMMPTKFRLRIYAVDPITGGPGADICDKIIDVDNFDDIQESTMRRLNSKKVVDIRVVDVDVKKNNIVIPARSFFIAVEWLRDRYNRSPATVYDSKADRVDSVQVYRPLVGISPVTGTKLNIWAMDLRRNWKLYDHFMPFGTDLAIKAVVEVP